MAETEIVKTAAVFDQDIICILGMHRSGTSVLARLLNLIGVDLGAEEVLTTEPVTDNPKGYWEHHELTAISDAILKRHGGSWHTPPLLPPGWETAEAIKDLRQRARKLIRDQFAGSRVWGWKDPRTCLTLPFWQQLLPDMRYIICLRNPVDVARSLEHRDHLSAEESSSLWLTYVSSALSHSEGKPRLIIFYEDLMDDSYRELQRLADFLRMPERARQAEVEKAAQEFVDPGLQHHRASIVQATTNPLIDLRARALYLSQRISASFGRKELKDSSGSEIEIYKALEAFSQQSGKGSAQAAAARLTESDAGLRSLSAKLSEKDRSVQRLSTQVAAQARKLQSQAEYAEETIRALTAQLREAEIQLQGIRNSFAGRLWNRCGRIKRSLLHGRARRAQLKPQSSRR